MLSCCSFKLIKVSPQTKWICLWLKMFIEFNLIYKFKCLIRSFTPVHTFFNDFYTFCTYFKVLLPSLDHYFQVIYSAHIVSFFKHLFGRKHKKIGCMIYAESGTTNKRLFFQRKMIKCDFRVIY